MATSSPKNGKKAGKKADKRADKKAGTKPVAKPIKPIGKKSAAKPYHHGNLRTTLVDTALAIIVEKGPRDLTLRDVARRAGVSHAAPYRHFDYKEAMLAAVAEKGFNALARTMQEQADQAVPSGDARERFHAAGMAYIRFAMEHPAHYRLMFGPELAGRLEFPAMSQASKDAFSVLEDAIAAGQTQGWVRSGAVRDFALAAWAMVHGFAMLYVDGQIKNRGYNTAKVSDLIGVATSLLYSGLRPA